jgi:choline dehydrogenase-like flavoprotein
MKILQEEFELREDQKNDKGKVRIKTSDPSPIFSQVWVNASKESKYGFSPNYNLGERKGGCLMEHFINNGVRDSTFRSYLLPVTSRPNLHILIHSTVTKILIENKTAKGVDLIINDGDGKMNDQSKFTLYATKEIILSAGTYHSPQILLLSGIGPKEHLKEHGIPLIADLPVGQHLQDHLMFPIKLSLREGTSWWPITITKMTVLLNPMNLVNYLLFGTGPFSTSGADLTFFYHSNDTYTERPDLQMHLLVTAGNTDVFTKFLGLPVETFELEVGESSDYSVWSEGFVVAPTLLHPKAIGSVTLRDTNPFTQPLIRYEAFGEEEDLDRLIKIIRMMEDILSQPSFQPLKPKILPHKSLAYEFPFGSDLYWKEYIKRFGSMLSHHLIINIITNSNDDDYDDTVIMVIICVINNVY